MSSGIRRRSVLTAAALGATLGPLALAAPASAGELSAAGLSAEDGYELWLRYRRVEDPSHLARYRAALGRLVRQGGGVLQRSAADELAAGLTALLGTGVSAQRTAPSGAALVIGTPDSSDLIRTLVPAADLTSLGDEGYVIRRVVKRGRNWTVVAAHTDRGVLYGAFHLLRLVQTRQPLERADIVESPAAPLRVADHWDNEDGSIERGYAGRSFFHWDRLPHLEERYTDYARVLASLGINGAVINNVNTSADYLGAPFVEKLAALAGVLRRYGVALYVTANFAAPIDLGGLGTADPFDADVRDWWEKKAAEIYGKIEDFGGFLVKANSEGRPGPLDYGRTHADGANLLARALKPYGGIVMWRAFVHDTDAKWDRQGYLDFVPLDGKFEDNAVLQIKNGPIDFQVREPAHPLFGSLPHTNSMIELQVTQEYTGHTTHLCYLVPQWKECLDFDTHKAGAGSTVKRVVSGRVHPYTHYGFAGVMNFGDATNWTGSHLAAANTHGYGRLSWNPDLSAEDLVDEWTRMTFGNDPKVVKTVSALLLGSWHTYEEYTSPLGTGYLTHPPDGSVTGHLDPSPTTTTQFHKSDTQGIGYDRTAATGDGYTALYASPVRELYESLDDCPEELLLFLHHVPYTHRLDNGSTVIQHIYDTHFAGAARVRGMRAEWDALRGRVDRRRLAEVHERFGDQMVAADQWRDTLSAYWFGLSRIRDERRSWIQATVAPADTVLLGGRTNTLPVAVANATGAGLRTVTTLDVPDGWRAEPVTRFVESGDVAAVKMSVVPPAAPGLATLRARPRSGRVAALDSSLRAEARTVITPPASRCVHALDAGTASSPLLEDYTRLSPADVWSEGAEFGWVGNTPDASDSGLLDVFRRDWVRDSAPAVLRLKLPAGPCTAYLLTGDTSTFTRPLIVRVDGVEKARGEQLDGRAFRWLRVPLGGGSAERETDLEFSSDPGRTWHLSGCVVLAD
ncbi:alpha-glucuronidase family glycosyl hydrolase [Streptomyces tsukubensis]|uniref:Xylan alpha-1,2-glucuronidase n=1 Tax=Streptomyces tsukubensis TaxID=83656 RepID=A0A1V4A710_9ACTN|nr:alpha-glucuronidase family glycosyl hydrolase [Streptomyces tsukubensis]OON78013.1 glycoside hydrolase [Streptomyces tsukubensis]QFR97178.1 glycoside hydrolase [Streptomyces tsukubensis]